MNGFLHYFLSAVDPMSNLGFSRAFPKLMTSALPSWWLEVVLPVGSFVLPAVIVWLAYVANSAPDRTRLGAQTRQAEPLVSVVTAGRNESATIGRCVRGALQCGYSNLEFIFVDDNSTDDSVAVARRAALSVTRSRHDTARVRIFPSPRRNGKASSLNIGIRMARGEFIVIHDAELDNPIWRHPALAAAVRGSARRRSRREHPRRQQHRQFADEDARSRIRDEIYTVEILPIENFHHGRYLRNGRDIPRRGYSSLGRFRHRTRR